MIKRALQAEEDGLQLLIYSLLAAVDRDPGGSVLPCQASACFEPSLVTRNSGLYALLYDRNKQEIWRSESITIGFPASRQNQLGEWEFEVVEHLATPYFRLEFALQWPDIDNKLQRYDVVVWRNAVEYFEQTESVSADPVGMVNRYHAVVIACHVPGYPLEFATAAENRS